MRVQNSLSSCFQFFCNIHLEVKLLDHRVILYNFLRNHHTVFQSSCTIFYSYRQCTWIPVSWHPHQHVLLISASFITAVLMGMKWYLTVIFICISLMTSDVQYFFMCLLTICISSLEKSFAHFIMSCLLFCCWDVGNLDIYILAITPLSDIWCANIFSHSVGKSAKFYS